MKRKSTTLTVSKQFVAKSSLVAAAVLMAISAPIQMGPIARADEYDERIQAIQREVNQFNSEAGRLAREADTLQNALNRLVADKQAIQAQIDLNQAQHDKLVHDIAANEKKIIENQDALGVILADLYVDDKITPLEMIASSKNIGDFLDKQEYRNSVRESLDATITQIKTLKAQLEADKEEVTAVLEDQKNQRAVLAAKEAERAELLRKTKNDENAYRSLVADKEQEIGQIQAEQQAAYERARAAWTGGYISSGGSGGYPWANSYWDPYAGYSTEVDSWGLFARQCTSYVAWKLSSQGKGVRGFAGQGHAYQWPGTTASYTSQRVGDPKVGDAAVIGYDPVRYPYGHVMYVESVNGNGTINISEYNFAGPGIYSERVISQGEYAYWTFITFPGR